ncbi:hypothetical protein CFBP3846_01063 [Pseudomonas syringae pv. avii]|uniref:tRNA pseudouridine synthase II TruB subfamily 1 C-terminal domain-containing protein n=1 Tax=Pseudomonas syringae pv. avii TaxID=663959 RepID=A0ABY1U282_PSESX|nr:hypothetical protein CFBP3846_01063 [Pseudomonas syringae pv. avii]
MKNSVVVPTSQNCAVPRPGLSRWLRRLRWKSSSKVHADGGNEAVDRFLMPSDSGLLDWPLLKFSEHSSFYWLHGQPVRAPDAPKFGMVRVQDHEGRFIGIG